jgi:hypothetical protein
MLAMRAFMRGKTVHGVIDESIAREVGLSAAQIEEMYQIMAIANYEDRFVIPTGHREDVEDMYAEKGGCGFSFGNGCSGGSTQTRTCSAAPARKKHQDPDGGVLMRKSCALLSALLRYPDAPGTSMRSPEMAAVTRKRGRSALPGTTRRLGPRCSVRPGGRRSRSICQEDYVALFDRGRSVSLHLFEHVHGESRDRGQAMVDLRRRLRKLQGLEIDAQANCRIICRCFSNFCRSCRRRRPPRNWPSPG